jgi:hypothetical protein
MSTLTDLLFGSDAEKRKLALQIADDLTAVVMRRIIAEIRASGQAVAIQGSIAGVQIDLKAHL